MTPIFLNNQGASITGDVIRRAFQLAVAGDVREMIQSVRMNPFQSACLQNLGVVFNVLKDLNDTDSALEQTIHGVRIINSASCPITEISFLDIRGNPVVLIRNIGIESGETENATRHTSSD